MAMAMAAVAAVAVGATSNIGPAGAVAGEPVVLSRVSRSTAGVAADRVSRYPAIDADGAVVAFDSFATNLVAGDTNGTFDVFVHDRRTSTTERVSVSSSSAQGDGLSEQPAISADGRFVAFTSTADNLIGSDTNNVADVFLRDRRSATTERVSVTSSGGQATAPSGTPSVSADGRFVVFSSAAADLTPGDSNSTTDVFLRDRQTGATERISVSSGGGQGTGDSTAPTVSADGNRVAFQSVAPDLVAGDGNGASDVFLRDRAAGTTARVSMAASGAEGDGASDRSAISADGTAVVFASSATNLVSGDSNSWGDVFVRRLATASTVRVSVNAGGAQANGRSFGPTISADGQDVAFLSTAPDLIAGDTNGLTDAFSRDLVTGELRRVSAPPSGAAGNGPVSGPIAAISGEANAVVYASAASDLISSDTNGQTDVFVHDHTVHIGPFTTWESFVRQQFVDFDGRQPTSSELTSWLDQLQGGTAQPADLIASLAHGTWATTRAPVYRLYLAFFLRPPDTTGMNYWVTQYQSGVSLARIAELFARSSEFRNRYGTLTNDQFVTLVYQNVFGRDADPSGRTYWNQRLVNGTTRGAMMASLSSSSEYRRITQPEVDTLLVYAGMLRQAPTPTVFQAWVADLRSGAPLTVRIAALLASPEYAARF